jgi:hypothetical protein
MDAKEEIKKTTITEPLKIAIQSIVAVVVTLLAARIPLVRDQIWPAIPKWLLMVLLVVLTPAAFVLIHRYRKARRQILDLRTENESLEKQIHDLKNPSHVPLPYQYGARWTPEREPRCPYCEGILINYIGRVGNRKMAILDCSGCGRRIQLKDTDGAILLLQEAQAKLSVVGNAPSNKGIEPTAG